MADRTEDRITELLPKGSVDELTRFVLTNAVYFLSNWASTFDEESTERREFTALDGTTTDVQTMFQSHRYPYAEIDGTQIVELPYENSDYGMVVVLPPRESFRDVEESLDAERLAELFDALSERSGALYLPRFTVSAGVTLNRTLADLDMDRVFDRDRADFTGVVEGTERPDLWLTGVYHKTFIEVAEWGTEAAAATGVVGGGSSAPTNPFEMHVDHPFLYCIRHRPTDSVLFLGRVVNASPMQ